MRSNLTDVETGREVLEFDAWHVRMECKSILVRFASVRVLVTLAPSLSCWYVLSTT